MFSLLHLKQRVSMLCLLHAPTGLLRDALSNGAHSKVLIDGFPRVLGQLHEFEQQVRNFRT